MLTYALIYYVISPLHVGAGRKAGRPDLPVQRDARGFPTIYKTSVKGAVKSYYRVKLGGEERLKLMELFGEHIRRGVDGGEVPSHYESGILGFTDAFPLALPVESSCELFSYVTSPFMLRRIAALLSTAEGETAKCMLELVEDSLSKALDLSPLECITTRWLAERSGNRLALQDVECRIKGILESQVELPNPPYPASELSRRLVVVHDLLAEKLVSRAMLNVTRVSLRYDRKRAEVGGLWEEEYVPEGAVFIGLLVVPRCRIKEKLIEELDSETRLEIVSSVFPEEGLLLMLGGKESIGKGLVKISVLLR